jgi:hypothetical protein
MSSEIKPLIAFILSLLSSVFIVLGGFLCLWMGSYWGWGWMDWMMQNWGSHMHFWDIGTTGFITTSIIGIVFGIIVVVAAVMLYSKPQQHTLWGHYSWLSQ